MSTDDSRIRWRGIFESNAIALLQRLLANYQTDRDDIADSDLDNEQPITIKFRGTLGDIRNARKALQCFTALTLADMADTKCEWEVDTGRAGLCSLCGCDLGLGDSRPRGCQSSRRHASATTAANSRDKP